MRQVSEIQVNRNAPRESTIEIRLRTPEAAKALDSAAHGLHLFVWAAGAVGLTVVAWGGGFGNTAHGLIRLMLALAALYWATHTMLRIWLDRTRTKSDRVIVTLTPDHVLIDAASKPQVCIPTHDVEIRFSARPDWRGKLEQRDERRVGHAIGYAFRDGWEVWCEAGLDVVLITAISHEDDARAIVRQLTEEYLFVMRGDANEPFIPNRAEPA
ncbi:MAG: hypothetical protein KDJ36_00045 [Hyphomicrobiaceae bacterium]|nr:hypothetical protein [Hyphomicrobiaceae bacterium]